MTRFLIVYSLLALTLPLHASADASEATFDLGRKRYEQTDFGAAYEAFSNALETAEDTRDVRTPIRYNMGNALYQMGLHDDAAQQYMQALRSTDLTLQERAYYNRGNALIKKAQSQAQLGKLEDAIKTIEYAQTMYENAMTLNPSDEDAKVNHELSTRLREQLEQLQSQQQPGNEGPQQEQQQQQDEGEDPSRGQEEQDSEQQPQSQPDESESEEGQGDEDMDRMAQSGQQDQREGGEASADEDSMQQMTPEEAQMLLDAMREEEMADRDRMRIMLGKPIEVEKNW